MSKFKMIERTKVTSDQFDEETENYPNEITYKQTEQLSILIRVVITIGVMLVYVFFGYIILNLFGIDKDTLYMLLCGLAIASGLSIWIAMK